MGKTRNSELGRLQGPSDTGNKFLSIKGNSIELTEMKVKKLVGALVNIIKTFTEREKKMKTIPEIPMKETPKDDKILLMQG